mmetsp:Transcript_6232/g.9720  ORF Transcript_6232/g.9720 Transcript_6232/m.9720 type:complete len:170 (+) Transcript_6232:363-872(+)
MKLIFRIFSFADSEHEGFVTSDKVAIRLTSKGGANKEQARSLVNYMKLRNAKKSRSNDALYLDEWLTMFSEIKDEKSSRFGEFLDDLFTPLTCSERKKAQQILGRISSEAKKRTRALEEDFKRILSRAFRFCTNEDITKEIIFSGCRAYKRTYGGVALACLLDECLFLL